MPLAALDAEEWDGLFDIVAKKLTLAMHYRCFGVPLSCNGRMSTRLVPNAHVGDGDWIQDLLNELPNCEIGRHGSEDLGSQIMTRWDASTDENIGIFLTQVQAKFVVVGMTGEANEWRQFIDEEGGSAPFD